MLSQRALHIATTSSPGPAAANELRLSQGLSAGDKVVVQGGTAVEDGMKVRTK